MKEIKFRAWDGNKMYLLSFEEIIQRGHVNYPEILEGNIMQFTGLKDKNGKEIYEGDIITSSVWEGEKFLISWDEINCQFAMDVIGKDYSETLHSDDINEVIGNIYENRELCPSNPQSTIN